MLRNVLQGLLIQFLIVVDAYLCLKARKLLLKSSVIHTYIHTTYALSPKG
jgi:hypothetical protein